MDEQLFQKRAGHALDDLQRALIEAGDEFGFDSDMNAGALTVEFESPKAKFVVSPNAPVRQIWVSAHSKSFKLDWDEVRQSFVHPDSGESLKELLAGAIGKQIGQEVEL